MRFMKPASLSAAAIASLVLAEAFEKTGEKIDEKVREQGDKLWHLLKDRFPTKANMIELANKEPLNGDRVANIEQELEEASKADPEVAQTVQAIANAVQSQLASMEKFTELAREIRMGVEEQMITHPNLDI